MVFNIDRKEIIRNMQVGLNLNIPVTSTKNFRGLWGKTSKSTDFDAVLNIPKTQVTSYYYPFNDESEKEIKQVLQQNTKADIKSAHGVDRFLLEQCKLGYTIPCSAEQYNKYYNARKLPSVLPEPMRSIDRHSSDKFRNNMFGLAQEPARNPEMRKREKAAC